jgi:hypothetical protein
MRGWWSGLVSTGFISLSAGWGLIRTDFLTPCYDITFSQSAEGYKRHRKADRYQDFRTLPARSDEDIVFFGGKDYVRLFCGDPCKSEDRFLQFRDGAAARGLSRPEVRDRLQDEPAL